MNERIQLEDIPAPTMAGGTFAEIHRFLTPDEIIAQAARCPGCGSPSCQIGCPIGNSIGDFHRLIARRDLRGAAHLRFNQTSALAPLIGSVCPQKDNGLCEDTNNCIAGRGDGESVMIGAIESSMGMLSLQEGWINPIAPLSGMKPKQGKNGQRSLGIIGSGPAGLRAAEEAVRLGWHVTIYEKDPEIGGLLTIGIPNFKLNHALLKGILGLFKNNPHLEISTCTEVGPHGCASLDALAAKHDLLLTSNGAQLGKSVKNLDVWGVPGVYQAVRDYLRPQSLRNLGFQQNRSTDMAGKDAVIFGLGYTAIDCMNTAYYQGAKSITVVSARVPDPDGDIEKNREHGFNQYTLNEIAAAKAKGVKFVYGAHPHGYEYSDRKGNVTVDNRVGQRMTFETDAVILAAGFNVSYLVHPKNRNWATDNYQYDQGQITEHNGTPVMILGDAALDRPDRLVVKAAAQAVNSFLKYHYELYPADNPQWRFRRPNLAPLPVFNLS